jgi:hypothetical protein
MSSPSEAQRRAWRRTTLGATMATWTADGTVKKAVGLVRARWREEFPDLPVPEVYSRPMEACGIRSIQLVASHDVHHAARLHYYPHDGTGHWNVTRPSE